MFLLNVVLAFTWAALTGELSVANLALGFAFGYVVLFFSRHALGAPLYWTKVYRAVALALYFLWELVVAGLRVAWDVVTPTHYMRPGIVAMPLDAKTDAEITTLANIITLTPGTMSLDVSTDRRVMYVHGMYVGDRDEFCRKIKQGFERRLLEVFR